MNHFVVILFLVSVLGLLSDVISVTGAQGYHPVESKLKPFRSNNELFQYRGGVVSGRANRKKVQKFLTPEHNPIKVLREQLDKVKPATRAHLLLSLLCSLIHVTEFPAPAPALLGLDSRKLWQLWRPFTSCAYFGPPSMSMANNVYFLIRYGQQLENEFGTGLQAWFLLVQVLMLSLLGLLLRFPFPARSLITAAVYVSCSLNPLETMPFQFGMTIVAWQLPYCLMLIDCLSTQSIAAAWPHVLGIFTGHVYHFFTSVWPRLHKDNLKYLDPPQWFLSLFGDIPRNNVGIDFRKRFNVGSSSSSNTSQKNDSSNSASIRVNRNGVINSLRNMGKGMMRASTSWISRKGRTSSSSSARGKRVGSVQEPDEDGGDTSNESEENVNDNEDE